MNLKQLLAAVDKIPGDQGWWHTSGKETYRELATRLAGLMPAEDALDVLESAYGAAADEFGC